MAKIQITWYSWLEFLFFFLFFLPLEDHEDIMLGMGAVGHICPLRCGYPSREARCLYTRGTWCIPVKANKMVSLWGARGQPIHNTLSLYLINCEWLTFPWIMGMEWLTFLRHSINHYKCTFWNTWLHMNILADTEESSGKQAGGGILRNTWTGM